MSCFHSATNPSIFHHLLLRLLWNFLHTNEWMAATTAAFQEFLGTKYVVSLDRITSTDNDDRGRQGTGFPIGDEDKDVGVKSFLWWCPPPLPSVCNSRPGSWLQNVDSSRSVNRPPNTVCGWGGVGLDWKESLLVTRWKVVRKTCDECNPEECWRCCWKGDPCSALFGRKPNHQHH